MLLLRLPPLPPPPSSSSDVKTIQEADEKISLENKTSKNEGERRREREEGMNGDHKKNS